MSVFGNRKVAAAVRDQRRILISRLRSEVDVIFLLYSSILTMKSYVDRCHEANKIIFIHMDFVEGIGKDRAPVWLFLKKWAWDGILTTRTNLIRPARDLGLITVQRFFIVDSHSVDTAVESIRIAKPDVSRDYAGSPHKKDQRVQG